MNEFFKNKKILITGHSGFKGSWLTQILLQFQAEVVGVSLRPKTDPSLFKVFSLDKKMRSYFVDIRDFEKIRDIFKKEKPEIVFHLAAQPIVRDSYDDPLNTYTTNTIGTANVLEAIKQAGCVKSAVIITTDKVYNNKEWIYPYRENDELGGYDPYSASKAAADIIASSYIQSFFNKKDYGEKHNTLVAITRAGNVIGGGDWANYRLVPDIIRAVFERKERIIIRNPSAIRPWEHVFEPLSGYMMLAMKLYQGEDNLVGPWNFGPDDSHFLSVEEIVSKSIKIIGGKGYSTQSDDEKHEANILKLDTSKAKGLLGWKPRLNFSDTLSYTLNWYNAFYKNRSEILKISNAQIESFFKISRTMKRPSRRIKGRRELGND
ncbi:MAG: CDP-glucose 4,6-dehydratase [Parcubacteria group bacterium]|jgi:CDP-glucose 4,6-dehydratase